MADVTPGNLLGAGSEPNLAVYNEIHQMALDAIVAKYAGKLTDHPTVNYLQVFVEITRPIIPDVGTKQNGESLNYVRLGQMMDDELLAAGWMSVATTAKNLNYTPDKLTVQYDVEMIAQA